MCWNYYGYLHVSGWRGIAIINGKQEMEHVVRSSYNGRVGAEMYAAMSTIVDQADYSEMFIPLYMAKKHFRKEWHDVEKPLFPGCFFVDTEDIQPIQLA